jgi:cytochrome c553
MKSLILTLLLLLTGWSVQAFAQSGDLQYLGQDLPSLISECESCHGPGGVSDQPDIPSLAGKSVKHIQESIDQFYFYERHCPTTTYRHGEHESSPPMNMCSIASGLSDEEVLALAEYFSAQPAPEAQ